MDSKDRRRVSKFYRLRIGLFSLWLIISLGFCSTRAFKDPNRQGMICLVSFCTPQFERRRRRRRRRRGKPIKHKEEVFTAGLSCFHVMQIRLRQICDSQTDTETDRQTMRRIMRQTAIMLADIAGFCNNHFQSGAASPPSPFLLLPPSPLNENRKVSPGSYY